MHPKWICVRCRCKRRLAKTKGPNQQQSFSVVFTRRVHYIKCAMSFELLYKHDKFTRKIEEYCESSNSVRAAHNRVYMHAETLIFSILLSSIWRQTTFFPLSFSLYCLLCWSIYNLLPSFRNLPLCHHLHGASMTI